MSTVDIPISSWQTFFKNNARTVDSSFDTNQPVYADTSSTPSIVVFTINQSLNQLLNSNFNSISDMNISDFSLYFHSFSSPTNKYFKTYLLTSNSSIITTYTTNLLGALAITYTASGTSISPNTSRANYSSSVPRQNIITPDTSPLTFVNILDNENNSTAINYITIAKTLHPYLRVTYTPMASSLPIKIKSGSDFIQAKSLKVRQNDAWVDAKSIYQYKSGAWVKL